MRQEKSMAKDNDAKGVKYAVPVAAGVNAPPAEQDYITLPIDPARVCFGLSRIGYIPASALCDIVDNSITAKAQNINIIIRKENPEFNDNRKNNIREFLVIDDGDGMDEQGI